MNPSSLSMSEQPQKCTPPSLKCQGRVPGQPQRQMPPPPEYHSKGVISLSHDHSSSRNTRMGMQTMLEYKPFLWWRFKTFLSGSNYWLLTQTCSTSKARRNQNQESSLWLTLSRYDQRGQNYHRVRLVPLVAKFPRRVHTVEATKS